MSTERVTVSREEVPTWIFIIIIIVIYIIDKGRPGGVYYNIRTSI